jgi:hypothetical protein
VKKEGYRDGNLQWRSRRQKLVSIQRANAMETEPLLLSLERHPSSIDNEVGLRPYVYAIGPHGLIARWRGSALAWPLVDAVATESACCAPCIAATPSCSPTPPRMTGASLPIDGMALASRALIRHLNVQKPSSGDRSAITEKMLAG